MNDENAGTGCEGCARHKDWTYDVIGFVDTCPGVCRACARFYDDMYEKEEDE